MDGFFNRLKQKPAVTNLISAISYSNSDSSNSKDSDSDSPKQEKVKTPDEQYKNIHKIVLHGALIPFTEEEMIEVGAIQWRIDTLESKNPSTNVTRSPNKYFYPKLFSRDPDEKTKKTEFMNKIANRSEKLDLNLKDKSVDELKLLYVQTCKKMRLYGLKIWDVEECAKVPLEQVRQKEENKKLKLKWLTRRVGISREYNMLVELENYTLLNSYNVIDISLCKLTDQDSIIVEFNFDISRQKQQELEREKLKKQRKKLNPNKSSSSNSENENINDASSPSNSTSSSPNASLHNSYNTASSPSIQVTSEKDFRWILRGEYNLSLHANLQIAIEEASGRAQAERDRMRTRLLSYNFRERKIGGDGNCQFRALADQIYSDEDKHKMVRKTIIKWLRDNEKYEIKDNGVSVGAKIADFLLTDIDVNWKAYCNRMSKNRVWGDHMTLIAASEVFGVKIYVLSSVDTTNVEEEKKARKEKKKAEKAEKQSAKKKEEENKEGKEKEKEKEKENDENDEDSEEKDEKEVKKGGGEVEKKSVVGDPSWTVVSPYLVEVKKEAYLSLWHERHFASLESLTKDKEKEQEKEKEKDKEHEKDKEKEKEKGN